ncbi:nucleotide pyrophosphohydrolase [Bordetella genomosp. 1]|uniref:Nucleotide pyrophosphohydrolase n=1 Tax=Bordetella genomosp. 1 TaxID=1395607 RepID=A0A261S7E5_9BORD|nr:nucleotide pyrophosphohydrolase [Bordetella genomosp. 1]MDQ8032727.1 nucleotide pyrophosphohydrolase [Bordetella sp.]OZI32907.1 nucleotide pyrophosphohydrolase [Bordetella genomosp. 1]OZI57014.1 nucleotide pyrophosphohydrolase [Bordetella genomosp. 1]
MSDLQRIRAAVRRFTAERAWEPFHSPKNLAMALAGEAGELVAEFQWLTEDQSRQLSDAQREAVADEIADVQLYLVALADQLDLDIAQAVARKMEKNALKYPADAFHGSARKYDADA